MSGYNLAVVAAGIADFARRRKAIGDGADAVDPVSASGGDDDDCPGGRMSMWMVVVCMSVFGCGATDPGTQGNPGVAAGYGAGRMVLRANPP